ncbi:LytTR family transcriptional regulator [Pedobacter frigiditerrae]|uniref:LytTR family transcriptional regulator n=1 Tax=Pedobacter frigiditerrae TaxID=2530452 RepID=A0A4R0MKV5_9SPHI|nr:LytTR family DNA-binding domain-containing protein [Pedobacter frigiditerrae]TCC86624.1 LytTR family transcriptional regulator [Pedobacter frigiditerrae]
MMLLEFLNLGGLELVMIFVSLFFLIGIPIAIILIVNSINKKKDNFNQGFPVNHYTVNVNGANELDKMQNATSTSDVAFKFKESSKIALPQQSEIRYVEIAEIIRCEADDNYTKFVLEGENILVSRSLKEYADQLKPKGFLRTHQSHLVNPIYVKSWLKEDGGMLQLNNNEKIPVSKPNREIVKEALGK